MPIKRHHVLITITGVKALLKSKTEFRCRYDLVDLTDGTPSYNCVYLFDNKEHILTISRVTEEGLAARSFKLWPGLFKHHFEFGDGTNLGFEKDFTIHTGEIHGANEVPKE